MNSETPKIIKLTTIFILILAALLIPNLAVQKTSEKIDIFGDDNYVGGRLKVTEETTYGFIPFAVKEKPKSSSDTLATTYTIQPGLAAYIALAAIATLGTSKLINRKNQD